MTEFEKKIGNFVYELWLKQIEDIDIDNAIRFGDSEEAICLTNIEYKSAEYEGDDLGQWFDISSCGSDFTVKWDGLAVDIKCVCTSQTNNIDVLNGDGRYEFEFDIKIFQKKLVSLKITEFKGNEEVVLEDFTLAKLSMDSD